MKKSRGIRKSRLCEGKARKPMESLGSASLVRTKDLERRGIRRPYLKRLEAEGSLLREDRGLYSVAAVPITEHHSLVEAAKRVPKGVVCLLSALRFHEIGTQSPSQVWMAIGEKAWRPRVKLPPLRIVRFAPVALRSGVETHHIEGVPVPVYSPAKTVADCFKYRNKIGLDVALEALRECWRRKLASMDELWKYGQVCRVANVMRPYLESLV
jgi:predicted transcriptional regulator of viral defense system